MKWYREVLIGLLVIIAGIAVSEIIRLNKKLSEAKEAVELVERTHSADGKGAGSIIVTPFAHNLIYSQLGINDYKNISIRFSTLLELMIGLENPKNTLRELSESEIERIVKELDDDYNKFFSDTDITKIYGLPWSKNF